ncbi:dihydroxyacetone kinase subunit L [Rhizobium laguerreae]|uniref:dihydroxyacetone kinase subunit DhaL n=1 Tax=Rhizobium TaxID=379 RepID=UPI0014417FAD|nr:MULTISPECIES: dihydroxyacetone kinase subunit DhaL [Rhizobium]NKK98702.1 dihydroxyacetone kinase subunit L [Rhizobium leguminosarum bv. viciae]MBY3182299.1 dihydroxyacetone kinase subunit L [Rhizobium laguerreae]MBY3466187.1 dihydroxyacetone kinase subunit L [Rhizobium laguerreae]MBY5699698.1 dihydroxyacetone kinase subunit L [Rhizobium leguminosarum]MBY5840612.1 dihydroxyacetone kinase subunit L [Rhizobium leguminosarum]
MQAEPVLLAGLIEVCRATIAENSDHLCALDRAIGDGDHGTNMRRGCEAVSAEGESLSSLPFPDAMEKIGLTLVMNVGGAAGPLYGTLLMEIGRELRKSEADFSLVLKQAIDAVARRGRAHAGDKTLLDVLYPVHAALAKQSPLGDVARRAERSAIRTAAMKAMRGRAAYLGDRSIGHVDPGASSCALLTTAICRYLGEHRPQ